MADSDIQLNEAFKRLEAQVEENNHQDKPAAKPEATPTSSGGVSGALGILLGLIALGVASYGAFIGWQLQQQMAVDTSAIEVQNLSQKIDALTSNLDGERRQLQQQTEQLASRQATATGEIEARISQAMAEMKDQIGTSSEDWLLAEAEYLLRLANQRAAMEGDVAGAIGLFKAADQIIRDAEGIVAFELRSAIANDIASLEAVASTDVQGIFVRLGAISGQVNRLQQKVLSFQPIPVSESDAPAAEGLLPRFVALLTRIGNRLSSLVDYRASGEVVTPILPPEEDYYLRQNLILKLQLAQLGLLQGNTSVYRQSLGDSIVWIDQYFDADAELTRKVRGSLVELGSLNIGQTVPDVSGSLREIRKLLARFHDVEERADS